MPRLDVEIRTADGNSNGTLHVPDGPARGRACWCFPTRAGVRDTFRQMGGQLAGMGYVALIPDIYYRAGEWAPFDVETLFTDPQERARLGTLVSVLTNDRVTADAAAYADFLLARPEVSGSAIGTTGYCLGGRMSMVAAGGLGATIAAAASFHGGRLAVADDPSSPTCWRTASPRRSTSPARSRTARSPPSRPRCLTARSPAPGSTTPSSSTPPATVSRSPTTTTYDAQASARHWAALGALYRARLQVS